MRFPLLTILAVLLPAGAPACAGDLHLGTQLDEEGRVLVSLWAEGSLRASEIELYRSTTRFDVPPDTVGLPITVTRFRPDTERARLVDSMTAHNARYFYRARVAGGEGERWSGLDSVDTPDAELGRITGSSLLVDKLNYFLEVRDGGRMRKRYPVALGRRPRPRKLHQDNATTPEGIYRITGEQPHATFHKAFDIDYPNGIDNVRYRFARENGMIARRDGEIPGRGGEIQVHGEGIGSNWTFGCIALRNEDIDELFEHPRVGRGMPVIIVGSELTRADVRSIRDYRTGDELRAFQRRLKEMGFYEGKPDGIIGRGTRFALGRLQRREGLPVTCDFDARTVPLLAGE